MTARRRRPTGATPDAIRATLQQEWDSLRSLAPADPAYAPDHSAAVALVALALAVWREEA